MSGYLDRQAVMEKIKAVCCEWAKHSSFEFETAADKEAGYDDVVTVF